MGAVDLLEQFNSKKINLQNKIYLTSVSSNYELNAIEV